MIYMQPGVKPSKLQELACKDNFVFHPRQELFVIFEATASHSHFSAYMHIEIHGQMNQPIQAAL